MRRGKGRIRLTRTEERETFDPKIATCDTSRGKFFSPKHERDRRSRKARSRKTGEERFLKKVRDDDDDDDDEMRELKAHLVRGADDRVRSGRDGKHFCVCCECFGL